MKLALVIPWFGRDLKGGAEQQAWQIATRLSRRGHAVEVLTTCCRSFHDDWSRNHISEGRTVEPEGFGVTRFAVLPRDRSKFDAVCAKLAIDPASLCPGVAPITPEQSHVWVNELIRSPALVDHLAAHHTAYEHFILLPYLYGPVIEGVRVLRDKSTLQPCLHDESYAYLTEVTESFYACGRILFNSIGELELATKLYGPAILPKSHVVGEGVELCEQIPSKAPAQTHLPSGRYVLYLGRKESGKNVDLLVRAFERFRAVRPNSALQLVLAGHGKWEGSGSSGVHDVGFVTEQEKALLLKECLAVAQPSTNESFSRAMMEAWLVAKPVLVHRQCLATAMAVKEANGGLLAVDENEWAAAFATLDRMLPSELNRLGSNGAAYAKHAANWETVISRYETILRRPQQHSNCLPRKRAVNQFLPNLTYGDAISEHALFIRDALRKEGWSSDIYVQHADTRMADESEIFTPRALERSDAAIYHHSIASEMTSNLVGFRRPKALIYHNITPAEFFEPWRPDFAELLHRGRIQLAEMARDFPVSYGVSQFNADELVRLGFTSPRVISLSIDPAKWAIPPDEDIMGRCQDRRTNVLFVGRITPNKRQDDLLLAFARFRRLDPTARLTLVGQFDPSDPFAAHLRTLMAELGVSDAVEMTGSVDAVRLHAYYRTADLFWSMSEHEGFCAPLVEAMWFDIPIFAYRSSAVPETLGHAAFMFTEKTDLDQLARLAYSLTTDETLRAHIIKAQRKRREDFLPDLVESHLHEMLAHFIPAAGDHRIQDLEASRELESTELTTSSQ